MKLSRLLIFFSLIFIFVISISIVSANSDLNCSGVDDNALSSEFDESNLSSYGNIITVEPDSENPNQMVFPTIQNAIDSANSGDTIILKGNFAHCQFTINKTLNIIGQQATLGPCPNYQSEGANDFGVFYVTSGGSGSVFEGINFINNAKAVTPFAFLINGASNITISDCTIDYDIENNFKFQAITIKDSNNVNLNNLFINNTLFGITIINSSNVFIGDSIISNSVNQAISIGGSSYNINVNRNIISNNRRCGISLTSANYVSIVNNEISNNGLSNFDSGSGIYVNTNITKLIVRGNLFLSNGLHAILYDYRARNLNNDNGAENLTVVDNNYFEGHSSMILHHRIYVERDYGTLKYDAENDVYGDVGEGKYAEGKYYVYMRYALVFSDMPCGFTYYSPDIPWSLEAPENGGKYDFSLRLDISQIKKGVYRLSVVDVNGNVAGDFYPVNITFFLNDFSTLIPQQNDVYKTVLLKNGVAIADFRDVYSSFKDSNNVITAVFPGLSEDVKGNPFVQLKVDDGDIPINPSTKLLGFKLTTYPLSDSYFSAKLVDNKGNAISNQLIAFKFNGKTYNAKTNKEGVAKVKVSLSSKKSYLVTLSYAGNGDYNPSKSTSSIVVKTGSKKSKIISSNMKVKRNKKFIFKIKLASNNRKALKNQKVIVKVNSKTFTVKTNAKGISKLSLKLSKVKRYKISMKFLGNSSYKASSKTSVITVIK